MINKKAQGLPIQTIIIFGILIIVAFIIIFFFSGKFNFFSQTVGSCPSQGGICLHEATGIPKPTSCRDVDDKPLTVITQDCAVKEEDKEKGGPCCIPVG